ncbi:MurR/RpiR family transcriptional regulator [Pacificoceanicola onchidii]|uniref:MurR/RpiR family transcriptional regulator n=1 Tax=Pacificoceanicola onchidii TaxID=2562685 RepID=UPI0010A67F6D|nr:MurR/RpiR family transcriptional regulator [Pacificoceanicola onchidii]
MNDVDMLKNSVLDRIRRMMPYFNPALKRIGEQVLKSPETAKSISIKDLAEKCKVSESTVTRFVREIDAQNFQQFKIRIAEELSHANAGSVQILPSKNVYEDITRDDDIRSIVAKISARYAITVDDTQKGANPGELQRAVEAIEEAQSLAFFAMGSSLIAVENALVRFMRVGVPCQFFRDQGVRQISTATLNASNLAIGISNSGRTIPTVDALKAARAQGAKTLCITSFPDSPIAEVSDIRLFTSTITGATGSGEYKESMVSKIAQLQMIDVLYSIFAVRNFGDAIEALEETDAVTRSTRY